MRDPESGVEYPSVLAPLPPFFGMLGIVAAFTGFVLIVPVMSAFVIQVGAWVQRPGDFGVYEAQARAYELPIGLLAGHLGLAMLTLVALAVTRWLHKRPARWMWSVQPGMRWRYLLLTFLIALVLLNGMLWISFLWEGKPEFHAGQEMWPAFLAVALVSAPLQALAEEVFFRGYLMQAIGSMSNRAWMGVVGSALIFAFMHGTQNPALFAHRFAFGLIAGWLVVKTGGLEAAIGAHVVNNLGAYGYAIFQTSVAEARAISEISWTKSGWDIFSFFVFAAAAWWLGKKMNVSTTTP